MSDVGGDSAYQFLFDLWERRVVQSPNWNEATEAIRKRDAATRAAVLREAAEKLMRGIPEQPAERTMTQDMQASWADHFRALAAKDPSDE